MQGDGRGAHTIVNESASTTGSVQARFNNRALLYYIDGRVTTADAKELREHGFQSGYGSGPSEIVSFTEDG